MGAPKRAFRARHPPIFTLRSFQIDVFPRVFLGTSKFCNLKIDASCEASFNFQHMSENVTPATEFAPCCHLTQPCQCDLRKTLNTTRLISVRLPRKMTMYTSKVLRLPRKLPLIVWKRRESIAPATQNDFRRVAKHAWMSRSATPATRNEATKRWKLPKRTPTDGCGRLRTLTQCLVNTPSTPRPPEWNGNPCYAFGKNTRLQFVCACQISIEIERQNPWAVLFEKGLMPKTNIGFRLDLVYLVHQKWWKACIFCFAVCCTMWVLSEHCSWAIPAASQKYW